MSETERLIDALVTVSRNDWTADGYVFRSDLFTERRAALLAHIAERDARIAELSATNAIYWAEIVKLRALLTKARECVEIFALEGCDHSVGICACAEKALLCDIDAATGDK